MIIINNFTNYIPNKYITTDERHPPWMNETITNKIKLKKFLYKSNNFIEIQKLSTEISDMILKRKEKYIIYLYNLITLTPLSKFIGQS